MRVDLLTWWYLGIFGLFLPYVAIRSRRAIVAGAAIPPLRKRYKNTLAMQTFLLVIALFAARAREMDLFSAGTLSGAAILLAGAVTGLSLLALPVRWKHLPEEEKKRIIPSRPQSPADLAPWLAVSLAAGIVEEIAYRGVMMQLVIPLTRNWWMAAAICAALFSLGHATQGWSRAVFVGVIALGLHQLVGMTGALYLAMVTHVVYDFLGGLVYMKLTRSHLQTA